MRDLDLVELLARRVQAAQRELTEGASEGRSDRVTVDLGVALDLLARRTALALADPTPGAGLHRGDPVVQAVACALLGADTEAERARRPAEICGTEAGQPEKPSCATWVETTTRRTIRAGLVSDLELVDGMVPRSVSLVLTRLPYRTVWLTDLLIISGMDGTEAAERTYRAGDLLEWEGPGWVPELIRATTAVGGGSA